ncbi:MAG: alpha/beta fold hydrolase [Muribaculaceae bacterium]|nr:alpha/beta fold hydrolase [Muribaculaceae bacterium]
MKLKVTLIISMLCCGIVAFASDFVGHWKGKVANLPIVFHIANDSIWSATLDSPMQGAMGIKCGKVVVAGDSITINMPALRANFKGVIVQDDKSITGTFTQGMSLPLTLTRTTADAVMYNRPQEPQPPFVYNTQDVTFQNGDITLAGTLTTPFWGKKHKAVVLVSGSGSQNRDEELFGHKPFAVIADYLTRHGIAVLRYDDRGVGGSSKGSKDDTTLDLATDAMAAVKYLKSRKDIDTTHIGIVGHSEGGLIAVINAAQHPQDVNFIATLAGPYVSGRDILIRQNQLIAETMGQPLGDSQLKHINDLFDAIYNSTDTDQLATRLTEILESDSINKQQDIATTVRVMTSPWYVAFVKLAPAQYIAQVKCPVFAANGTWDYQVDAMQNLEMAQKMIPQATIKQYEGLNHMFQPSSSRQASMNYGAIETTISEQLLNDLTKWINGLK